MESGAATQAPSAPPTAPSAAAPPPGLPPGISPAGPPPTAAQSGAAGSGFFDAQQPPLQLLGGPASPLRAPAVAAPAETEAAPVSTLQLERIKADFAAQLTAEEAKTARAMLRAMAAESKVRELRKQLDEKPSSASPAAPVPEKQAKVANEDKSAVAWVDEKRKLESKVRRLQGALAKATAAQQAQLEESAAAAAAAAVAAQSADPTEEHKQPGLKAEKDVAEAERRVQAAFVEGKAQAAGTRPLCRSSHACPGRR